MFKLHQLEHISRQEILAEFVKIGVDSVGASVMSPKSFFLLVKVYDLSPKQANIIKQEMLGKGGEAAVARGTVDSSVATTDVVLMGTEKQYRAAIQKLRMQPFKLAVLAQELEDLLNNLRDRRSRVLHCRDRQLPLGERTLVMGILNVTPDSFSDGGRYNNIDNALAHARRMVEEGADIIDVGGESTRPGYTPVSVEDELSRVIPVVEALAEGINVPVSVDTTKALVARRALAAGAHLINDQWALRFDGEMADVVAEYNAPIILMHNQRDTVYRDLIGDMVGYLCESVSMAEKAGISKDSIIIDPGFGLGKTAEQNLILLRRLRELTCLGLPILLGTSRKSTIGKVLGGLPEDQRIEGTGATVALGIANGADIVRVHDVKEMARVAKMADAVVRGNFV